LVLFIACGVLALLLRIHCKEFKRTNEHAIVSGGEPRLRIHTALKSGAGRGMSFSRGNNN
jgi:hypothetical protein